MRESLIRVRGSLLALHRALVERERAVYERANGPVSPGEMLQLLISGDQFSWLRPMSELIVRIDEIMAGAVERRRPIPSRPVMTADRVQAESRALLAEVRALLSSEHAPVKFRQRYDETLQDDPAIVLIHQAIVEALPDEQS